MFEAVIRESECIGCSRCVSACPVDAIIGSNKYLHTVLSAECIGCQLCVAPCPVDCIDIVARADNLSKATLATTAKARYQARQERVKLEQQRALPVYNSKQRSAEIRSEIEEMLNRADNG